MSGFHHDFGYTTNTVAEGGGQGKGGGTVKIGMETTSLVH